MQSDFIIIACSIFKYEIDHLKKHHQIEFPVVYLNSMLHMHPERLEKLLDAQVNKYKHYKIILLYGDCHARMLDYEKNPNLARSQGINCGEILLGHRKYRQLQKEGAFILLPEWAVRWKEAFIDYMGFKNEKSIQLFMNDMHQKLVYVDTGLPDKNSVLITGISEYFNLPLEIYQTSVSEFGKTIMSLAETLKKRGENA